MPDMKKMAVELTESGESTAGAGLQPQEMLQAGIIDHSDQITVVHHTYDGMAALTKVIVDGLQRLVDVHQLHSLGVFGYLRTEIAFFHGCYDVFFFQGTHQLVVDVEDEKMALQTLSE